MRFLPRRRKRSLPSESSAPVGEGPLVSVIVPVYNGETHLGECVSSLLEQSYPRLEIILVDDGSTDASGRECDRYAREDSRVVALHRPNGGLSAARNTGLDAARGELVAFVDADDVLSADAVASLVAAYRLSQAPVVIGKTVETASPEPTAASPQTTGRALAVYSGEEAVERALYQKGVVNSVCGALFERRLWERHRFRPGTWYEDLDIFYRVWLDAGRVAVIPDVVYLYRQHGGSFTHRFSERRADVLDVTDRMVEWIDRECPRLSAAARCRRLSAHINILGLIEAHGVSMPAVEERCRRVIRRDGKRYGLSRRAKLSMQVAMGVMTLVGVGLLGRMLAVAYRRR